MTAVRALLLTDVVDSTRLAEQLGDAAMARLWEAHDRLARELLPPHHGLEIDKTDGMLLMFERAADALAYARAYHAALASLPESIQARAGLHVGPVILRENRLEDVARGAKPIEVDGLAKPTAARVMALANGGQTLISEAALKAMDLANEQAHCHGHWHVKGVAAPLALFEVGAPPFRPPKDGGKAYQVARIDGHWLPVRQVPNNLPRPGTSFLGRDLEIDELKSALSDGRLVTLVGMGGLGKTRLAVQVATELLAEYPDGVWFLDLAPLREPHLVVEEAARLLQVEEQPGRPLLLSVSRALRDRQMLLIVDNCEHLLDAAGELVHALLEATTAVRLLTSSRVALRLPGECVYAVKPLPLPEANADLDGLKHSASVRLFVDRAQAQRKDYALSAADASHVAALVSRLEGIPLALELAAARVRSMSVADINARLQDRYRLLTGGSRVLHQRQQTLRALVDWSYELLAPAEQTLLQRLGVFVGGFDLTAAESVAGHAPLDPLDVVDLVDSLVEKSLVMADIGDGNARFRMLETLRDYAREKLEQAEGLEPCAEHHAQHFWTVARGGRDGLEGPEQAQWTRRLQIDLDNLRAAMAWSREHGASPLLAAKIVVALQGFWVMRGHLSEGRELVRKCLALESIQSSAMARAHLLYVGGVMADAQGDPIEARSQLQICLDLRREMDDISGMADTLSTLSLALLANGQAEAAREAGQEALELFRKLEHRVGEAIGLQHLGRVAIHLGRWDDARRDSELARDMAHALQNLEIEGECEWLLAEVAQAQGQADAALTFLQAALQHCRQAGDRSGEARALGALGRSALGSGDAEAARDQMARALRAFREFEMRAELIGSLEDHAALAAHFGQDDVAVQLLAASADTRKAQGLVPPPHQARQIQQLRELLRDRMGAEAFDDAWHGGSETTLAAAQAMALALAPISA